MQWIKRNISDMMLAAGVVSISIGMFIWSVPIGFVVTGAMLAGLAYLTEGGD
ncbi:hypothetical protein PAJ34TS1_00360 [Paenibacillus azoreducens]|uniref:Uncharacterized protein n=1 Tax=Paenibacillus azoreducens TaxID=116718 RepID=A0A919YCU4_9BACL|nr:hypothetical protein J34TS1_36220 [Paenibacillus azoreducens]